MNRTWVLLTVVGLALLVGCESDKEQSLGSVPPDDMVYQSTPADQSAAAAPPPASTPAYSAPAMAAGDSYTIRRGDTLWSIAVRYYNDGQRWKDIVDANPGLDPTKLRVGQQIVLPALPPR